MNDEKEEKGFGEIEKEMNEFIKSKSEEKED